MKENDHDHNTSAASNLDAGRRHTAPPNEALTPGKLAEMAPWIEQEAPEAFRVLKGVNTFIEGQVMAQQTPGERMISTLLQETNRRHGPTLNALAAHGGENLREKPLPIYASRGRCEVDVQLNAWHQGSFCAFNVSTRFQRFLQPNDAGWTTFSLPVEFLPAFSSFFSRIYRW